MSVRKSIVAVSLVLPALSAFALDQTDVAKSVPLKNGSTLHQFKDGKMAVENKYGSAVRVGAGTVLEAADGKSVTMTSDEVARLSMALQSHNLGGR